MTRKKPPIRSEVPLVEPAMSPSSKAPLEALLKRTKLSLESLLAETPENSRDEAWEKMPSVGKEC